MDAISGGNLFSISSKYIEIEMVGASRPSEKRENAGVVHAAFIMLVKKMKERRKKGQDRSGG